MYKYTMKNCFVSRCLLGEVLLDEIDDYVDCWHESNESCELYEFLGMTQHEYRLWVHNPDILPYIIKAHRDSCSIDEIEMTTDTFAMAARADSHKEACEVMKWLSSNYGV